MSNKLVKNTKQEDEKSKPISSTFGGIFLGCGVIWLLIILIIGMSGVPTNLDGTEEKAIVVTLCVVAGLFWVILGIFCMAKKPEIKIDRHTAKWMMKELEKEMKENGHAMTEEEKELFLETMKDTRI